MSDLIKKRIKIPGEEGESVYTVNLFLTDSQLRSELEKCEYCAEKPCMTACPCDCSPADFIKAVSVGDPADYLRSAALIMSKNPLGGICGQTCPDKHCMAACVHKNFNTPVDIPAVQATIIQKAKQLHDMPKFNKPDLIDKHIAVIGAGPAGLASASHLTQNGCKVTIFEKETKAGGMCNLIPDFRLDKEVLRTDIEWTLDLGALELVLEKEIHEPEQLLNQGFDAVVVSVGLWSPILPGIANEKKAIPGIPFLKDPDRFDIGSNVAIIGGGATAFDCAMTALLKGADQVEIFALENISEMPLTGKEMAELIKSGVDINGRMEVLSIHLENDRIKGISARKVRLEKGKKFNPGAVTAVSQSEIFRQDIDTVIIAIGARSNIEIKENQGVFYSGDCVEGPSTVVEASAAGKNTAEQVLSFLKGSEIPAFKRNENGFIKSKIQIPGFNMIPVDLVSDFFGKKISSPFLLSAAPPSDGLDQMIKAYEAGWAGGIMKTAFNNVPIHIPGEYMFRFSESTFANCDNVSGHSLDRTCKEVEQLVKLFPDRLTMASTGGPVTGNDEEDMGVWQNNTRMLESAGIMGIEYSLSCPQGGDGTEGDIVSQNAALSQKIISWILDCGDGNIPKIFKLTGAVTSIEAILLAIKEAFDQYPEKKAGITLANTFPTMAFRPGEKKSWEEGVIVGMAGTGVLNISYLSLAKAAPIGLNISGNGGAMTYKEAADNS